MSAHLTNEDLMRYLAGEEAARVQTHLGECEACREEAAAMVDVVGGAKARIAAMVPDTPHGWIRQRNAIRMRIANRRIRRPSWKLAAALAVLMVASAFLFRTPEPRHSIELTDTTSLQTEHAISDDALLASVNDAIERDVPSAMAPLQQFAYEREQAEQQSNRRY